MEGEQSPSIMIQCFCKSNRMTTSTLDHYGDNSIARRRTDKMTFVFSYDFIEDQRLELGDEFVDNLLDSGYEPVLVPGSGWRWVLRVSNDVKNFRRRA